VKDTIRDVNYITKYATKGWTNEIAEDHDRLVECIVAMRGRRLLATFGAWRNHDVERDENTNIVWRRVGRLVECYDAAKRGERWAIGLFQCLGVVAHGGTDQMMFDKFQREYRPAGEPEVPDSGSPTA
jgi:hypothetical protein